MWKLCTMEISQNIVSQKKGEGLISVNNMVPLCKKIYMYFIKLEEKKSIYYI